MAGKRRISSRILAFIALASLAASACGRSEGELRTNVEFRIIDPTTKAPTPDEELISGYSLMIFDNNGQLESHYHSEDQQPCTASLLKGEKYSIYACINFGYDVRIQHLKELKELTFHLAYPDEYKEGIPMAAYEEFVVTSRTKEVTLEPVRLMSKISIGMDRSRLSEDVKMEVSSIRIGNCPKRIKVFEQSRAISEDDCFPTGFEHIGPGCAPLNKENSSRASERLSL